MSSPIIWVTEGGELCTADWAAWLAGAPACVCRLHVAAVRSTALVSDQKRIRGVRRTRRCTILIDNLYLYLLLLLLLLLLMLCVSGVTVERMHICKGNALWMCLSDQHMSWQLQRLELCTVGPGLTIKTTPRLQMLLLGRRYSTLQQSRVVAVLPCIVVHHRYVLGYIWTSRYFCHYSRAWDDCWLADCLVAL